MLIILIEKVMNKHFDYNDFKCDRYILHILTIFRYSVMDKNVTNVDNIDEQGYIDDMRKITAT